jgi:hypothetical protein
MAAVRLRFWGALSRGVRSVHWRPQRHGRVPGAEVEVNANVIGVASRRRGEAVEIADQNGRDRVVEVVAAPNSGRSPGQLRVSGQLPSSARCVRPGRRCSAGDITAPPLWVRGGR